MSKAAIAVTENTNKDKKLAVLSNDSAGEQTILPCNREADNLDDVYKWSQVFPEQVLLSLARQTGDNLIKKNGGNFEVEEEAVRKENFEDYVTKLLLNIPSHLKEGKDENIKKNIYNYVVCCKLISIMIKLYKMRVSEAKSQTCFESEPEEVQKWIFSTFFVGEGRDRKILKDEKDKALAMAIVVMWTCFQYKFPAKEMRLAFNKGEKMFSKMAKRLLGQVMTMKVNENETARMCILKLPLPRKST